MCSYFKPFICYSSLLGAIIDEVNSVLMSFFQKHIGARAFLTRRVVPEECNKQQGKLKLVW